MSLNILHNKKFGFQILLDEKKKFRANKFVSDPTMLFSEENSSTIPEGAILNEHGEKLIELLKELKEKHRRARITLSLISDYYLLEMAEIQNYERLKNVSPKDICIIGGSRGPGGRVGHNSVVVTSPILLIWNDLAVTQSGSIYNLRTRCSSVHNIVELFPNLVRDVKIK